MTEAWYQKLWNWLAKQRGGIAAFVAWLVTRQWFIAWAGPVWLDLLGYAALLIGGGSLAIGAARSAYQAYQERKAA